jgi:hypothetical protein
MRNPVYNFTPIDSAARCPVCCCIFIPKQGKAFPNFNFYDGKDYAIINMCYHCAGILLQKIQQINPNIVSQKE